MKAELSPKPASPAFSDITNINKASPGVMTRSAAKKLGNHLVQ